MELQGIGNYVSEGLTSFGKEVNTNRQLVLEADGLKPLYRRLIYTSLGYPDRMIKTATLSGATMGSLHPHGDQPINDAVSTLVRYGVFDGQGNHGAKMIEGDDISPAASRYTEAKISSKYRNIFSELMDYVPYIDGEIEGHKEPAYLPTPIPICLAFGNFGLGFGVNARIPAFTVKSIYAALMADDPNLLEAPFGLELIKDKSDLYNLWERGYGNVTYSYHVEACQMESGFGAMITGDAELFKPRLEVFDDQIEWGRVHKINLTSDIGRVFVGRNYNVKAISLDDILDMARKCAIFSKVFRLTVSDGECCYVIPLKIWLRNTYERYLSIIDKYKVDKISKYEFDYQVYNNLSVVAECLINNRNFDVEDIVKATGVDAQIVDAILNKNIRTLRNVDSTSKLARIQDKIDYYKNLIPANKVKDIIDEF